MTECRTCKTLDIQRKLADGDVARAVRQYIARETTLLRAALAARLQERDLARIRQAEHRAACTS